MTKFLSFRLPPENLKGLRQVKSRDGVPITVQTQIALRDFLEARGALPPGEPRKSRRRRTREMREGEEERLLDAAAPHLRDLIVAALESGMRKGELLSLQWSQVHWLQNELYLPAGKTKAKKPRQIPISATLRKVLKRRQTGMTAGPNPQPFTFGQHQYVFGDEAGNRIGNVSTAWANGMKPQRDPVTRQLTPDCRARFNQVDLHFHDLRHEAGSRKLEAGWPLHAVSKWLGHSKIDTTSTYLNAEARLLHQLNEEQPAKLTLVKK